MHIRPQCFLWQENNLLKLIDGQGEFAGGVAADGLPSAGNVGW